MAKVVYPVAATAIGFNGATVYLREGDAWQADDPLVKARPELFAEEPREARRNPVEQATAAPGETRDVTRPKTTKKP